MGRIGGRAQRVLDVFKRLTGFGSIDTNSYVTGARTPDGSLVVVYIPTSRAITVDMSKLAGETTAQWFDPTNGRYVDITGSPFPNVGLMQLESPRYNDTGDSDWVLVLEAPANNLPR